MLPAAHPTRSSAQRCAWAPPVDQSRPWSTGPGLNQAVCRAASSKDCASRAHRDAARLHLLGHAIWQPAALGVRSHRSLWQSVHDQTARGQRPVWPCGRACQPVAPSHLPLESKAGRASSLRPDQGRERAGGRAHIKVEFLKRLLARPGPVRPDIRASGGRQRLQRPMSCSGLWSERPGVAGVWPRLQDGMCAGQASTRAQAVLLAGLQRPVNCPGLWSERATRCGWPVALAAGCLVRRHRQAVHRGGRPRALGAQGRRCPGCAAAPCGAACGRLWRGTRAWQQRPLSHPCSSASVTRPAAQEVVELVTQQITQIRQPYAAILGNHDAVRQRLHDEVCGAPAAEAAG